MTDALRTPPPPELQSIIDAGRPRPMAPTLPTAAPGSPDAAAGTSKAPAAQEAAVVRPVRKERGGEENDAPLVSITVRVPANIVPVLLKAASERKMKKLRPFTQQGIVTEALAAWLRRSGHLMD